MGRIIKFRAWLPDGHWAIPSYSQMVENYTSVELFEALGFWSDDVVYMQYIGLNDKNNVEIYEGDIGRITTEDGRVELFIVEWGIHRRDMKSGWTVDIPSFCFRIDGFPSFPIVNNYLNGHDLDIIDIIGNIYKHPHLLNIKK